MNKYIIKCTTNWIGYDNYYAALAEKEEDLFETANELAYENYQMFGLEDQIAKYLGYDTEEMTESDWDNVYEQEHEYYDYEIYPVKEDTEYDNDFWTEILGNGKPIE